VSTVLARSVGRVATGPDANRGLAG
jgi:hypothetical protein